MDVIVAQRLVKLRKKNGFSQEVLADKIGVSRQSVSKWERAEASPDTDNLIALAELYNITIDEMLYDDNVAGPQNDSMEVNSCKIIDDRQETENKPSGNRRGLLPYLPYVLFPIIINLMALWGGWWNPGFLIIFGAPVLKKQFEKKRKG